MTISLTLMFTGEHACRPRPYSVARWWQKQEALASYFTGHTLEVNGGWPGYGYL